VPSSSWQVVAATDRPLTEHVAAAHAGLVRRGHVDPVVAVAGRGEHAALGDTRQRWEIGSVTKVFTALLLAVLDRDGVVAMTDQLPRWLPAGTVLAPGLERVTLEQLASHRSGLPRLPPGVMARSFSRRAMTDPYADIDRARLLEGLARTRVRGPAGHARVRYSNYGMGLLGFTLGEATGLGYEQALARHVLEPLGLAATSFSDDGLHQGRFRRRPVPPWHLAALAGAGGLRSTAADLLALLSVVRDGSGPLGDAVAETLRPRGGSARMRVGLGWFVLGGGDLLMHNGGTLGARSEVRVERHTGRCVVVLGDGRGGTSRAAARLLDPVPGR
jgi:CubicO group peptidase (beta-lactamase class C family)